MEVLKEKSAKTLKTRKADFASIAEELFRLNIGEPYAELNENQLIVSLHLQKNGALMGTTIIDGKPINCKIITEAYEDIKEFNHSLYICDILSFDEKKGMVVKPVSFLSKTKHSHYDITNGCSLIDIESNQIVGVITNVESKKVNAFKIVDNKKEDCSYHTKNVSFYIKGEEDSITMESNKISKFDIFGNWIKEQILFIV